jgi:hypothetical protein
MNLPEESKSRNEESERGKKYTKPQVQIYGDLREITQAVGKTGADDGGGGGVQKTAP